MTLRQAVERERDRAKHSELAVRCMGNYSGLSLKLQPEDDSELGDIGSEDAPLTRWRPTPLSCLVWLAWTQNPESSVVFV